MPVSLVSALPYAGRIATASSRTSSAHQRGSCVEAGVQSATVRTLHARQISEARGWWMNWRISCLDTGLTKGLG